MSNIRQIIGIILIAVGVGILLGIPVLKFILPLFLVWLGWKIITGRRGTPFIGRDDKSESKQDSINDVAVFSSFAKRVISKSFEGGKAVAVFSDMDIDLSEVKSKGEVVQMELAAIFGDLEVVIPKEWQVESNVVAVIGEVKNDTKSVKPSITLKLEGASVFGSVKIKN